MPRKLIFLSGTHRSPTFDYSLPNRIHIVPIFWVFLAQPFALSWTRHHKVKPQSRTVRVGGRVDHMMVDIEFVLENVPIPGFLKPEFVKRTQKLIDDPLFHEFLE